MKARISLSVCTKTIAKCEKKFPKSYRWISFNFKMIIAQVTFHSKFVDGGRVVHSILGLFRIVADAHSDVIITSITPDVIWHLKPVQQTPTKKRL